MDYVQILSAKIDELILKQKQVFDESDSKCVDHNSDSTYFTEFMDIQTQINHYANLLRTSRDRAMNQICYNQLMFKNQQYDNRRSQEMKDYVMITLNPMPNITIQDLKASVKQFMTSAFVEFGQYVFEQRSSDSNWHGFHSHMLFKRCRRPSVVREAINRIFSHLVDNPSDSRKIKIKSQDLPKDVFNYVNYMKGVKKDRTKEASVCQNRLWRESLGLEACYTVGDCSLLVEQSPVASGLKVGSVKNQIIRKKKFLRTCWVD